MGTHLIDTNAVIEYLGGILPAAGSQWIDELVDNNAYYLSIINRIELLSYPGKPEEMQTLKEFIEASDILLLEEEVVLRTISLRIHHKIKIPDAIIAATALQYELTLVTRNADDFKNIAGLKVINLHII